MPNRFTPALTCLAWLTAGAALAQPASSPSATVAPVTVQAAPAPKVIQKQSRTFVQTYAAAPSELDQIGRWRDPICVKVVGLVPNVAAMIKARVEDVAKAVGQGVGRAGCHANIEIVFTDKPQAVADSFAERREYLLGYNHGHDAKTLKTVTHPIQAWYATATVGGAANIAGMMFANIDMPVQTTVVPPSWQFQPKQEVLDDPDNQGPAGCADTPHFTACLKSVFRNILVVADSKALEGKDIGLLSDDIVMLSLSQPRSLDGCIALPSVIDAFAKAPCPGRDPPDGLTPADAAYLTALYSADLEAGKAFEVGDITGRMAKILIKASAAPAAGAGSTPSPPADAKAR